MDAEMQEEPTVPSSGVTTDEPVIPTDLECQVKTTETVTPVTEEEEPVGPPSIETRTVKTQRGNYATIKTRILDQLGRREVTEQGLTELVQGAFQPKPALGPAEVPGLVEVELVQMAQATTSQPASLTENQEPAGGKLSSNRRIQGEGHDAPNSDSGDAQGGDNIGGDNEAPPSTFRCNRCSRRRWRQWRKRETRKRQADRETASQERVKRDTKEEDGNPSYSIGQKD